MEYEIGQKFKYIPDSRFDAVEDVEITGLRKNGHAKLSNGWVVDQFGVADGNATVSGGKIQPL